VVVRLFEMRSGCSVVARFEYIGGIVDNQCLKFSFYNSGNSYYGAIATIFRLWIAKKQQHRT
jgi:hypothetical protein